MLTVGTKGGKKQRPMGCLRTKLLPVPESLTFENWFWFCSVSPLGHSLLLPMGNRVSCRGLFIPVEGSRGSPTPLFQAIAIPGVTVPRALIFLAVCLAFLWAKGMRSLSPVKSPLYDSAHISSQLGVCSEIPRASHSHPEPGVPVRPAHIFRAKKLRPRERQPRC